MELYQSEFESPIGLVYVVSDGDNLRAIDFEGYEHRFHRLLARHYGRYTLRAARNPGEAVPGLAAYFAGDLRAIDNIAVATNGTSFQQRVWAALRAIPAGTTVSYGAIARQIGQPTACRAVGFAIGSNPIEIVVPCHRVVGANSTLTGYAGGIERKQWLLSHEGAELVAGPRCQPALSIG